MNRWIFWDIGDTLLNEDPLRCRIWQMLADKLSGAEQRFPFDALMREREELARSGDPSPHYTIARLHMPEHRFDTWKQDISAFVRGGGQDLLIPVPGAVRALETLAGEYRLGLIADQPVEVLNTLKHHGMLSFFADVVLSETAGVNKPHTAIFARALERAGCAPRDALMVGNRLDMDISPARRVGMRTLFCYLHPRSKGWIPSTGTEAAYLDSLVREPNWPVAPDPADSNQQPDGIAHDMANAVQYARRVFSDV